MANKFIKLTKQEYEELCNLDYGDLYSIHSGVHFNKIGESLEIFVGVNYSGKLFINVVFSEGRKTFDFDRLSDAIKWVKNRVEVIDESN